MSTTERIKRNESIKKGGAENKAMYRNLIGQTDEHEKREHETQPDTGRLTVLFSVYLKEGSGVLLPRPRPRPPPRVRPLLAMEFCSRTGGMRATSKQLQMVCAL